MHVLMIDDHPLVHEIIGAVLRRALDGVVVSGAETLEGALARAEGQGQPDLVLLDLGLPGCDGLEALSRFRQFFPDTPVVVLSATIERDVIVRALEAGAVGYIPKTSKPDVMIAAVRLVAAGGTYVPREALDGEGEGPGRPGGRVAELTERQRDVLKRLMKGYTNQRIAQELSITESTVKQHAHAIFVALGVSSRAEAVIAATRRHLVD